MEYLQIIDVTPSNAEKHSLFCVKDITNPGFQNKKTWMANRYKEGLRMKIIEDQNDTMMAFIEYLPAEKAWRPVDAPGFMFIHCMYVYPNKNKNQGLGSRLVSICEEDARSQGMKGIAAMTSKGTWITDKRLFVKNGFEEVDNRGRYELMAKKFDENARTPRLLDWTVNQAKYQGWHILYADQCPWHQKSVEALQATAIENGITLNITKLGSPIDAQHAPSGYGVFSLLHDGKLLEDHYISQTRFKNILKKEIGTAV